MEIAAVRALPDRRRPPPDDEAARPGNPGRPSHRQPDAPLPRPPDPLARRLAGRRLRGHRPGRHLGLRPRLLRGCNGPDHRGPPRPDSHRGELHGHRETVRRHAARHRPLRHRRHGELRGQRRRHGPVGSQGKAAAAAGLRAARGAAEDRHPLLRQRHRPQLGHREQHRVVPRAGVRRGKRSSSATARKRTWRDCAATRSWSPGRAS